ncbi:heat shock protein HspQ [Motilimonas cestriensis]|uniref:Heat shock protein HspQ n=1 Tax=Motilimonas cestriensis TaxID=2742685 RepID=A0ABS8WCY0_9GAMM|nr:heat shock protein HspQ [Motilimonas cestriensis]MCE2596130.1 heat shock protein HspQ [Motilimonas cestriensis]
MTYCKFHMGQLVDHQVHGYRGVVYGVDATFNLAEQQYQHLINAQVEMLQPWYLVMVDGSNKLAYIAESNLLVSTDHEHIEHPMLALVFTHFNGERYFLNESIH